MKDTPLDDAILMMEVTQGDPELLAIDNWLRGIFAECKKNCKEPPSIKDDEARGRASSNL